MFKCGENIIIYSDGHLVRQNDFSPMNFMFRGNRPFRSDAAFISLCDNDGDFIILDVPSGEEGVFAYRK